MVPLGTVIEYLGKAGFFFWFVNYYIVYQRKFSFFCAIYPYPNKRNKMREELTTNRKKKKSNFIYARSLEAWSSISEWSMTWVVPDCRIASRAH